jgi:hypothetical protein
MATLTLGSSRREQKKARQAQSLVAGQAVAYGSGTGHVRFSQSLVGTVIGFVALFVVVLLVLGRFLIPGVVLLVIAASAIRPRRGVAITPQGIFVMHENMVDNMPNQVVAHGPISGITSLVDDNERASHVRLAVGREIVRLRRTTYAFLCSAANDLSYHYGPAVPDMAAALVPRWCVDPIGRFDYRYWDGIGWTEHVSRSGVHQLDPIA